MHTRICKSQPSSFSPLLFLVARHSIAYEHNIYFYLFSLPLYLNSLGNLQDAGAEDFLGDKMLYAAVCPRLPLGNRFFRHKVKAPDWCLGLCWKWQVCESHMKPGFEGLQKAVRKEVLAISPSLLNYSHRGFSLQNKCFKINSHIMKDSNNN